MSEWRTPPELDPFGVLGLDPMGASDEDVAAAYTAAVRRSPPDRDPDGFREARQAFEALRGQARRAQIRLFGADLRACPSVAEMLPDRIQRPRAGAKLWLNAIRAEARLMETDA